MAKKTMLSVTVSALAAFAVSAALLTYLGGEPWLTLAITFGTVFYHFGMRLAVGYAFNKLMNNKADVSKSWYRLRKWETKLYKILKVKSWKNKLSTYTPDSFSPQKHTWNEIAQAMCQSELVHETIIILSFAPLLAVIFFDSFWVFFITSAAAAIFDSLFVITQRYNRGRIMKIASREKITETTIE